MTGDMAYEFGGPWGRAGRGSGGPRGHRQHHHGRCAPEKAANWLFSRGGPHERPLREEIEELVAMRRMWGGGGPGGPFGRGPGGRGRGRGRARRGDVRLALLRLLAEEPRNGYS